MTTRAPPASGALFGETPVTCGQTASEATILGVSALGRDVSDVSEGRRSPLHFGSAAGGVSGAADLPTGKPGLSLDPRLFLELLSSEAAVSIDTSDARFLSMKRSSWTSPSSGLS